MTTFYLAALVLAGLAMLALLQPWRRTRLSPADLGADARDRQHLNAAIYRDQLAELERDRAVGQLAEDDYRDAHDELQRRLLADTRSEEAAASSSSGRGFGLVVALIIVLGGAALYAVLGKPEAMLSAAEQEAKANASMEELVAKLAKKLEANPDNPQGWAMLARSYKAAGRIDDAEKAYNRIGPSLQQDAGLLAELADLLALKAGSFDGRPRELLRQALAVGPDDPMTLWLAGTDALDSGRFDEAIKHWQHLLTQLEPGSEEAQTIKSGIELARQRGGKAQKLGAGEAAPKAGAGAISGRVELAPALRAQAKADDILFIFARAEGGPRMPLAAIRRTVGELPYNFTLSDANAMAGGKLSEAAAIRIEARVARSGTAAGAAGDLIGRSAVVKPGAKGIKLVIDSVVP